MVSPELSRPRAQVLQVPQRLLGAHVGRGPQRGARQRLGAAAGRGGQERPLLREPGDRPPRLGQASVDDQGLAVLADDDIARLDVAVQHAPAVRVLDGVAYVEEPPQELAQLQRPPAGVPLELFVGVELLDGLLEALAPDEPHGVVGPPVPIAAQTVNGDDSRVLQPASHWGVSSIGTENRRKAFGVETDFDSRLAEEESRPDFPGRLHRGHAMRLLRMSTRRWMALVMVVGIGLAGRIQIARWKELRGQYEMQAEMYAAAESQFRQHADRTRDEWRSDCREVDEWNKQRSLGLRKGIGERVHPPDPGEARRWVDQVARPRKKYERAAAFPWLPLEADPAPARR
jgi:hypothetical protein